MRFEWEGFDSSGKTKTGEVEALSREDAITDLRAKGIFLHNIQPVGELKTVFKQADKPSEPLVNPSESNKFHDSIFRKSEKPVEVKPVEKTESPEPENIELPCENSLDSELPGCDVGPSDCVPDTKEEWIRRLDAGLLQLVDVSQYLKSKLPENGWKDLEHDIHVCIITDSIRWALESHPSRVKLDKSN